MRRAKHIAAGQRMPDGRRNRGCPISPFGRCGISGISLEYNFVDSHFSPEKRARYPEFPVIYRWIKQRMSGHRIISKENWGYGSPKVVGKDRLWLVAVAFALLTPTGVLGQQSAAFPASPPVSPLEHDPASPGSVASVPQGKMVVLDHVVAVINGSVILQSDVTEEMGYAVLQPFSINKARNTPQSALQRLIDRDLILQQIQITQSATVPTPEEVQQRLTELRQAIPECVQYDCKTEAGWQAFLGAKGLTEKEVEAHWSQRMSILSFIQSRFGAGVRISQAEIADYYNKTLVPQFRGTADKPPPLTTVSDRIEEILLQQRVSSLLLEWLQSLKSEGSVSILDPAYGQVGTTGSGDDSGGQP
jgi:peptidyl-prolyl cis-trans isomerase SurA